MTFIGIVTRWARPYAAVLAGVMLLGVALAASPASAQNPAPAAQRRPGRQIRIGEFKIEGQIQKPQAFYILQRSNLKLLDVANALKSVWGDSDAVAATLLKNVGYTAAEVGAALKMVWGDSEAAAALDVAVGMVHRLLGQTGGQPGLEGAIDTGDGQQFRLEAGGEDTRRPITIGSGQGPPA